MTAALGARSPLGSLHPAWPPAAVGAAVGFVPCRSISTSLAERQVLRCRCGAARRRPPDLGPLSRRSGVGGEARGADHSISGQHAGRQGSRRGFWTTAPTAAVRRATSIPTSTFFPSASSRTRCDRGSASRALCDRATPRRRGAGPRPSTALVHATAPHERAGVAGVAATGTSRQAPVGARTLEPASTRRRDGITGGALLTGTKPQRPPPPPLRGERGPPSVHAPPVARGDKGRLG